MIRPLSAIRHFLRTEAAGGIVLMLSAAAAMAVANSPLAETYFHLLHADAGPLSIHHWINDAAMALFFLLVGLEIKREFLDGHLSQWSDRILPFVAAGAGMVVPAIVYLAIAGTGELARGWAIPSATDIAFAIGVLALLGSRAPASLKLFLTTVAIVDDMGAVAIIALAYTPSISGPALLAAAIIVAAMWGLGRFGVTRLWPYLLLSLPLWIATYASGVHATIAGVIAALMIPRAAIPHLEHALHPWVAFAIVPLFGFANAGVALGGIGWAQILAPLPVAVALGLFLGKQIGIFTSVRAAVALGWAGRPDGASWAQIYGVALLCGIGFTMSLFIGGLAFDNPMLIDAVKIGVLGGSILSAIAGYAVLRFSRACP